MLQKGRRLLFFPVETVVRELDFRLILAALCARAGWQILIGDHEHLFSLSLRIRNVVQVLKNVTGGKNPWKYDRYKALGHRIIQLDEEGGVYEGDKDQWKSVLDKRLDVRALDKDDHVCTWGTFQAEHYRSLNPACADNIHATGHPRLDLGKKRFREIFQEEAAALRARHGDFLLINTNLVSNNVSGPDILLRHFNIKPEDTETRTYRIEQYAYDSRRYASFIELINHLSNTFPSKRIVVRPHPSENIRAYQTLLRYIPRTVITREGSLHAWLLAAQVLIHSGCTTAIEGHLCGTPIVNFQPVKDDRFTIRLPNLIGDSHPTPNAVASAVHSLLNSNQTQDLGSPDRKALEEVLRNFDLQWDSFDHLAAVIHRCQDEAKPAILPGSPPRLLFRRCRDYLARFSQRSDLLRRIFQRTDRGSEKFPPLHREEILRRCEVIRRITGKPFTIHFHSPKILSVTLE